jgi:5'-deoxynucleotidase YfbR-like HD superfamily hydrolase
MKELLNFFIEIGKLKKKKRKGWMLRGVEDPETIASHTFRMAIISWLLGRQKKLNINKILRMSLIHDLCEVYAGDTTPYDRLLHRDKKQWKQIISKWPRLSKREKEKSFLEKYKKETEALEKLILKLSPDSKKEIRNLWADYEKGLTREGRFVRQVDRVENLLQALEYWKKNKQFAIEPWWIQIEELVDDPTLLEFLKTLEEKFH